MMTEEILKIGPENFKPECNFQKLALDEKHGPRMFGKQGPKYKVVCRITSTSYMHSSMLCDAEQCILIRILQSSNTSMRKEE